jgi:hypothetical protein
LEETITVVVKLPSVLGDSTPPETINPNLP